MAGGAAPGRPLPLPDEDSAPFWEGCARGVLRVRVCEGCGRRRFPPRPMCPACHSMAARFDPVSGRGRVYSFVQCHPPLLPAVAARAPYLVAVVELADDPAIRMIGGLLGCALEEVRIGLAVKVDFEDAGEGVRLPQLRPSDETGERTGTR